MKRNFYLGVLLGFTGFYWVLLGCCHGGPSQPDASVGSRPFGRNTQERRCSECSGTSQVQQTPGGTGVGKLGKAKLGKCRRRACFKNSRVAEGPSGHDS